MSSSLTDETIDFSCRLMWHHNNGYHETACVVPSMTPPSSYPKNLSPSHFTQQSKKTPNCKMSQPKFLLPVITTLYLTLFFLNTHFSICNGVSSLGQDSLKSSDIDVMVRRVCTQSIEACLAEQQIDSETNRRVLVMQKNYISYDTLKRDMVPCARPGASYYACHAREANRYNRGCEVITRCARDIKDTRT